MAGGSSSTNIDFLGESLRNPGNLEAGRRLHEKYAGIIARTVATHGVFNQDTEDLTQEVLGRVVAGFHRFTRRGRGSFRAWLRRICRSAAADWFRANPGRAVCSPRHLGQAVAETVVEAYEVEILESAIWRVRMEIPPDQWDLFVWVRVRGLPAAEIAAHRGLTRYAVYKAGHRVAERLRRAMNEIDLGGSS